MESPLRSLALVGFLACAALGLSLLPAPHPLRAQTQSPKPTCSMVGNPNNGSVSIKWTSTNATTAYITSVGSVDTSGAVNLVLPLSSPSTYVGTFTGPGGTATCSVSAPPGVTGASSQLFLSTDTSGSGGSGGTSGSSGSQTSAPTPNGGLVPCGIASVFSHGGADATNCNLCDFAALIQSVINFLLAISTVIATGLFAYAGVLFFTNATNAENLNKGKAIFKSVAIGFVIALTGYLVVQTLLNTIVNQSTFFSGGSWFNLQCADKGHDPANAGPFKPGDAIPNPADARPRLNPISYLFGALTTNNTGGVTTGGGSGAGGGGIGGNRGVAQCSVDNTACSVDVLQAQGLTAAQANAMSCIAITENSGQAVGCSGTGPCGTFQISQTNWAAYAPAGCASLSMQNNAACNLQTAAVMLQKVGYQPWTGNNPGQPPWNAAAKTCVNNYDPNTNLKT